MPFGIRGNDWPSGAFRLPPVRNEQGRGAMKTAARWALTQLRRGLSAAARNTLDASSSGARDAHFSYPPLAEDVPDAGQQSPCVGNAPLRTPKRVVIVENDLPAVRASSPRRSLLNERHLVKLSVLHDARFGFRMRRRATDEPLFSRVWVSKLPLLCAEGMLGEAARCLTVPDAAAGRVLGGTRMGCEGRFA